MKRVLCLAAAIIGLFLTSSCDKDLLNYVLLEGNWGLTRFEMVTTVNGSVIETLGWDCNPNNPRESTDALLAIEHESGNIYTLREYFWDPARGDWMLTTQNSYTVRDNVFYSIVNGRETEASHFQLSSNTLTLETVDVHLEQVTTSRSIYRRMNTAF